MCSLCFDYSRSRQFFGEMMKICQIRNHNQWYPIRLKANKRLNWNGKNGKCEKFTELRKKNQKNKQNKKRIGIEASPRIACVRANYKVSPNVLNDMICAKRMFHPDESIANVVFVVLSKWRKIIVQTRRSFERIQCEKRRLSKKKRKYFEIQIRRFKRASSGSSKENRHFVLKFTTTECDKHFKRRRIICFR